MEFTTHLCCALAAVSALCAPAEAAPMALRVDLKQIQESPNNDRSDLHSSRNWSNTLAWPLPASDLLRSTTPHKYRGD
jgi:hypothetical protein